MITRAIVEQVVDTYHIKVRIPFYNKISSVPTATQTKDLTVATICTLPNSKMNYQVGDIVFIGFEDHMVTKPVILGQLSREEASTKYAELTCGTLNVKYDTHLSPTTYIGEVKPEEISYLKGANSNLQLQLDILSQEIAKLNSKIDELKTMYTYGTTN